MPVVKVENLKAYYVTKVYGLQRTIRAVDGVSLELNANEIFGIAGESGCGKSTLMKVLFGIIQPPLKVFEGTVTYYSGNASTDLLASQKDDLQRIRWGEIAYIPQGSMNVLNPVRRVRKTFQDFIRRHRKGLKKKAFESLVNNYLQSLGLPISVLSAYPHQLSGGMRQRVTIALATILHPRIVFADEPSTALDVVVQRGIIQLLKKIQAEYHNTFVIVTHDMAVHANFAHRVAIMYAGKIVELGNTRDIFANPLHCYTKYLIGSLPKIGDKAYRESVPGNPPLLIEPPNGCWFAERCPEVQSLCSEQTPALVDVGNGHKVACFRVSQEVAHES
jgi:peptide/nickel transport system ATP-binding protein